jgi:hypothetical protein
LRAIEPSILRDPISLAGGVPQPAEPATRLIGALTVTTGLLLFLLALSLWHTPFALSETVALLEDVERDAPSRFFELDHAYVRPLFYLTLSAVWHNVGSVRDALAIFKMLHIAAVVWLVVIFIRQLRPRSPIDAAAAMIAVAVLMGHGGFRENLENLPLNQMMVVMVLSLVVWGLLERDQRAWHAPVIVGLTVIAIGFKEQGLLIAPMVLAAWWMGAPGVSGRTAVATAGVATLYLFVRLYGAGSWELFPQRIGFGFATLSPAEAAEQFGPFPLTAYGYSAASTMAAVLFSEPSAGVFSVIEHTLQGRVLPWEINHVISSLALTALIVWWGRRAVRREADGRWSLESRVCVAALIAVTGSAALGFAYTRDRMGGVAVVFYALAAFHALRAFARQVSGRARGRLAAAVALMLLAAAWQVRVIGTIEFARETAERNRREWLVDLRQRRIDFADRLVYTGIMSSLLEQGTAPLAVRPTPYPRWIVVTLGIR